MEGPGKPATPLPRTSVINLFHKLIIHASHFGIRVPTASLYRRCSFVAWVLLIVVLSYCSMNQFNLAVKMHCILCLCSTLINVNLKPCEVVGVFFSYLMVLISPYRAVFLTARCLEQQIQKAVNVNKSLETNLFIISCNLTLLDVIFCLLNKTAPC